VTTLTIRPQTAAEPFEAWRDGEVLDEFAAVRARVLVAARARVRVHPEVASTPAGWDTLEQAVGTLRAVYGDPLPMDCDTVDLATLYDIPIGVLELFGYDPR
jgi:hypothetical protein